MLQDKRKDLDGEKLKTLMDKLVRDLSGIYPELYYQPTSQIARLIEAHIRDGAALNGQERDLVRGLKQRDIEILLSLKN